MGLDLDLGQIFEVVTDEDVAAAVGHVGDTATGLAKERIDHGEDGFGESFGVKEGQYE